MRGIDHDRASCLAHGGECGEDPVEDARLAPADEAVVERLRRAVDGRSIPPSQALPDDMDYPADDAPVIDTRPAIMN